MLPIVVLIVLAVVVGADVHKMRSYFRLLPSNTSVKFYASILLESIYARESLATEIQYRLTQASKSFRNVVEAKIWALHVSSVFVLMPSRRYLTLVLGSIP